MVRKKNSVCHVCNRSDKEMAVCSAYRCSISYCFQCIKKQYDKEFESSKYIKNCWVCYSCGKSCKCDICEGVIPSKRKRVYKEMDYDKNKKNEQKMIEKQQQKKTDHDIKHEPVEVKRQSESYIISLKPQTEHLNQINSLQNTQILNFSTNSLFVPSFQPYNPQPISNEQYQQIQYIIFYF